MNPNQKRSFTVQEASDLSITQIHELYSDYINPYQVELLGTFGAGRKRVTHAEGCFIHEEGGRKILDLTGGIGVLNHGHNHPSILKVRREFAEKLSMEVHKSYFSPYVAALAHNIAQLLPGDLNVSYFPNSGAEAVEGAIKLAFKGAKERRTVVAHADISFHGKLLNAGAVTGSPENHFRFPTKLQTVQFQYNNEKSLRQVFENSLADGHSNLMALIIEPLNASSMTVASESFLLLARELCDLHGVPLIFDEVYSGWGKTGYLFNFMRVPDLVPDILCYAKSLGGGKASIAGYTARTDLASRAYFSLRDATLHSTTYFGFGEETVSAIEAIRIIVDDGLVQRAQEIQEEFSALKSRVDKFESKFELSGSGALWGITIKKSFYEAMIQGLASSLGMASNDPRFGAKVVAGALVNHLYEKHSILTYVGFNRTNPLIVSFPLIANSREVELAKEAIIATLNSNLGKLIAAFVKQRLTGPRAIESRNA